MAVVTKSLTSFDIYTKYIPGLVLETYSLRDTCCGMNPCYYMEENGRVKASTSVMSLILESGRFEIDETFRPPYFSLHPLPRNLAILSRKIIDSIERPFRTSKILRSPAIKKMKSIAPASIKTSLWNPHHSAYNSWGSIDKRIRKLRPFETVSAGNSAITINTDCSLGNMEEYIEKSVEYIRDSIQDIESDYPSKKHIILMGGKDSQLIGLVPKLNESNWYIFSAEPNYTLIKDWVSENGIQVAGIFRHDGNNEESLNDFKKKILCGDLYTNPVHVRYAPTLKRIANDFNNECIFWLGSMPRGASLYDGTMHKYDRINKRSEFFEAHLNSFPAWQGNIHQTYSNFTGCPFLCPYYLDDIWRGLYAHLDPLIIGQGSDLRPLLGERLSGRKITWPATNPGPIPYKYWYFWFSVYRFYLRTVSERLK